MCYVIVALVNHTLLNYHVFENIMENGAFALVDNNIFKSTQKLN